MIVALIGSTGEAGKRIARLLAQQGVHDLILIGRNTKKLNKIGCDIKTLTSRSVECRVADACDVRLLSQAMKGAGLAVVATSSADHLPFILEAATESQTDLYDIMLSGKGKHAFLDKSRSLIEERGLCFITDGGYHPGIPAAMVRQAMSLVPDLEEAVVYGSFNLDWRCLNVSRETMLDFTNEIKDMETTAWVNGAWVKGWKNTRTHIFPMPANKQQCMAMFLEEMRTLPALYTQLRDTGFYIGGFGAILDKVVMPSLYALLAFLPGATPFAAFVLGRCLKRFSPSTQWAVLELEGKGKQGKHLTISLSHPDPYALTALPVVATINQYANNGRRAGLWLQAHFVKPAPFFDDMKKLGASYQISLIN